MQSFVNIADVILHEDFYRSIYLKLAQDNGIDVYSYQFEVMLDQDIYFSQAQGCARGCLKNGELNIDKLRQNFQQMSSEQVVQSIVNKYLSSDESTDRVKKAMLEAFQLGRASTQKLD